MLRPDRGRRRSGRLIRSFARSERGGVAVVAVGLIIAFVGAASLTVDYAALALERRAAQGAVDLAALAAIQDIGDAEVVAKSLLEHSGFGDYLDLTVRQGRYLEDLEPVTARFQPVDTADPEAIVDAVEVSLRIERSGFFSTFFSADPHPITVSGVAARRASEPLAAITIGSRLLSLNGGIANQLLGTFLGATVSLSVMDYQALLDVEVNLFSYLDALETRLGLTAATYDEVLATNAPMADALMALADAAGPGAAAAALALLALDPDIAAASVAVGDAVQAGPAGSSSTAPGLAATLTALDLLMAVATIADGEHQATLDLGLNLPGVADLTAAVTIGERPQTSAWLAVGGEGSRVETRQTQLDLAASLGTLAISSAPLVSLPLTVNLAIAEAEIVNIVCDSDPASTFVDVAVRPAVAEAWIGSFADPDAHVLGSADGLAPVMLIASPTLTVTGQAYAYSGTSSETIVTFTFADIAAGTIRTVASSGIVQTLVASLIADTDLSVTIHLPLLQITLGTALISMLVEGMLSTATPAIDDLVDTLLAVAGIGLGKADVSVAGLACDEGPGAALVI